MSGKRFKLIKNKSNLGISSSGNIGIDAVKSKYITFVDHGDTLNKFTYEKSLLYCNDKINWVGFRQTRCDGNNHTWVKGEDKIPVSGV